MSATGSAGSHSLLTATRYSSGRWDVVIDRPAADVWQAFADPDEAQRETMQRLTTFHQSIWDETSEDLGDVVLLTRKLKDGAPRTAFFESLEGALYVRIIKEIPPRQRVYRLDAVDEKFAGFIDYTLIDLPDGQTKLVYSAFVEIRRVTPDQAEAYSFEEETVYWGRYTDENLGAIKVAAEQGRAAT